MKKILTLVLLITFVFTLSGCEDKEGECKQSGENFDDCYKRKKSCTSNINETRTQRRKPAKIKEPRAQNES